VGEAAAAFMVLKATADRLKAAFLAAIVSVADGDAEVWAPAAPAAHNRAMTLVTMMRRIAVFLETDVGQFAAAASTSRDRIR